MVEYALLTDIFKVKDNNSKEYSNNHENNSKRTISHEEFFDHFNSCEECRSKILKLINEDETQKKLNIIIKNQEKLLKSQKGGGNDITKSIYDFIQENPLLSVIVAILLIEMLKK